MNLLDEVISYVAEWYITRDIPKKFDNPNAFADIVNIVLSGKSFYPEYTNDEDIYLLAKCIYQAHAKDDFRKK